STKALIDSGSTGLVINKSYIEEHRLEQLPLPKPIKLFNANESANAIGHMTHYIKLQMQVNTHLETRQFHVTELSSTDNFLSFNWLKDHN
ncbi:hypothetical protein WOLCODRAFT_35592, partial [Wolfiporia cocos MD-104 SS10]